MSSKKVVVVGAGIIVASTALWLARAGHRVTLIDRDEPGMGASYGNAGVLAACSVAPVTAPGLALKGLKLLLDPNFPLFLRWGYLPRLAGWLMRYLSHANDRDTRRIAKGLTPLVADALEQHKALVKGTRAERWLQQSTYSFAYKDRQAFEADAYTWELRRIAGFQPTLIEGDELRQHEPSLSKDIGLLAQLRDHGYISNPAAYTADIIETLRELGGKFVQDDVQDFELAAGKISKVLGKCEIYTCDAAVVCSGVFSKSLMHKLGLNVPLEAERGYHIVFKDPSCKPNQPIMVASGKFVATPMEEGLRCAGVVEFGGTQAGPSTAPLKLLRKKVKESFPKLSASSEEEWLGFRPAPTDSLPLIGELKNTGIYTAFGHHHIGLTAGPKTGRLVADLISGQRSNNDLRPYDPTRFQ
ncbi:NAD(P)/FAD-dependent oxidoreductase [Polycladidibacter hongkongensis]|uniref:NAD(P)/FAD-dependent oxidoreductase n=1 Tax=Polycladidibacter hongkongensis TaxID=1647556 RepID=UPI00082F4AA1|nr:FAD-dependent oxidoreductase [Pseudovibrio hongkongensis]